MELIFVFLGGVAVGSIITLFIEYYKTGHGGFTITPSDDSEDLDTCTINIRIPYGQTFHDKKKIILNRDYSQ